MPSRGLHESRTSGSENFQDGWILSAELYGARDYGGRGASAIALRRKGKWVLYVQKFNIRTVTAMKAIRLFG
ncbi:MAG TPA: hypothetical protein VNM90_26250 [Haliangium sp.]|nr:hypothetical protein [Haliangium sp.]